MYTKLKHKSIVFLDILGISSGGLCLFHCLIFPVLSIIPIRFSDNHWIDVFFACIGIVVVSKIVRKGAVNKVKLILIFSISVVIIGVVLEIMQNLDTALVLIGGVGMIVGHLVNYKSTHH
jgi:hypothetical protein